MSSMKVHAGAAPPWKARTSLPAPTTLKEIYFPVRESGMYGGDNVTVPEDIQEGGGLRERERLMM